MKDTSLYLDKYFLSPSECTSLLTLIYSVKERFSLYRSPILDGISISAHLSPIAKLLFEIQKTVDEFSEIPLAPLASPKAAINIHFTPPGGEYRWHYDSKAVKAILYLNRVEGGEIDIFEDYRILLTSQGYSSTQKVLDQILQSKIARWLFSSRHSVIQPEAGELVLMKANRCLHSVRPVRGTADRVSVVFLFDTPGKVHKVDAELDPYFYSGPGYFSKSA